MESTNLFAPLNYEPEAPVAHGSRFLPAIGCVWGILLALLLGYYLNRSWKRGQVWLVGSHGIALVNREKQPGWYWFAMGLYLALLVLAIAGVFIKLEELGF
jgi:hypothetical protein